MGGEDAEAEDVGEHGVDWGAVVVLSGAVRVFGAAGNGLDAASDEAHDLSRRPTRRFRNLNISNFFFLVSIP